VLHSYVAFAHADINGFCFAMPAIEKGVLLMTHEHPALSDLQMQVINFMPKQALLMPFDMASQETLHVFVFASDEEGDGLQELVPILERIVYIVSIVMENRSLLQLYKELNEELDYRVELRSQALQEVENKYQTLVESSDTSIMLLADGKFVECNAATLRIFGCASKEEFLESNPVAFSPAYQANGMDSETLAREHIEQAMTSGSNRFDWIHKRMNGEEFFADVHLTRVLIQGQMMVQAVIIDISERVLAEKTLNRYKHIVSISQDMMAVVDNNYTYLTANPAYLKAFNKQYDDVVGSSVADVFGEAFFQTVTKPYGMQCMQGKDVHFQQWIDFPAYGLRYMDVRFYPYRNHSGEIIGFIVDGRDATKQKRAEEALQASEAKYRELVEHMQDCVYRTDADGKLTYASPSIQSLMACQPDELIGECWADYYVDPHGREKLLAQLNASPDGKVDCFEVQMHRKDGKIIWLSVNTHYIYDDAGKVAGVEGSLREITKLKEMESKFNQAQKMEAVGTLVGGIAHDFNNILAGMVGSFYLMKYKQQDNPELIRDIEELEQQSFRAADMIKQLLTFSRKGDLETKNFSFSLLIKEVFKLAKRTVPENISLAVEFCKEPLFINGDASLLQQVLMNLMNNSRDAVRDSETPSIQVSVQPFVADQGFVERHPEVALEASYACLCIKDNGCGISEEGLTRVFEPFYTTKAVGEGTGLGMAMIYGSIQSHQGFIEIDSVVGEGTKVDIFLPTIDPAEDNSKKSDDSHVLQGHGELILCVDDEVGVCNVNIELLNSLGYKTLQASDGLQALDIFEQHNDEIAMLLTDVVMPNMGGIELANKLWQQQPELPVIFVSGYDESKLSELDPTNEHICILEKPFSVKDLSYNIHQLLSSKA